jgi:hypothetical protein
MLVSMVVVLGLVGLSIDTGYLELVKIRAQTAADAAALGGVNERKVNGASNVTTSARADAAANGFTHGANGVTVTVNNPPASGYYTGDSSAVEVIVKKNTKALFLSLLGFQNMGVTARAVARLGAGTNCMYVLDGSVSGAMSISGGVTVQTACGVVINSSSNTALTISGGSRLQSTYTSIAGSYSVNGGSSISPIPVTHTDPEADPLASLAAPAVGACDHTSYSISGGATGSIAAGVYCNGISASGGSRLTLGSGTYILKGGGLNISGGAVVTGSGVIFYLTQGGGYSYGAVSLSGGTTVTLSAPTTGPFAGILFFQDRSVAGGGASTFSGGTMATLTGTLYFPTTNVSYSGGSTAQYTILIVKRLSFSGGTMVNNNYSSLPSGPPVKGNASLSE